MRRKLGLLSPEQRAPDSLPPPGGTVGHIMFGAVIPPIGALGRTPLTFPMPGDPLGGSPQHYLCSLQETVTAGPRGSSEAYLLVDCEWEDG